MNETKTYPTTGDQDVDPRVVAVHRVVDLERQAERAEAESMRSQKTAAIVAGELREARDQLAGLLGYPSNGGAKGAEVEMLRKSLRDHL